MHHVEMVAQGRLQTEMVNSKTVAAGSVEEPDEDESFAENTKW